MFVLLPDNAHVPGEEGVAAWRTWHRPHPGPLTVLWERSRTHDRSRAVQPSLARPPEIVTEECPSSAPALAPAEPLWTPRKSHTLATYAPPNLDALRVCLEQEARELRERPGLLAAFIKHAELTL
jgi:hypothetical protein